MSIAKLIGLAAVLIAPAALVAQEDRDTTRDAKETQKKYQDDARQATPAERDADGNLKAMTAAPTDAKPGLWAKYYRFDQDLTKMPDLKGRKPDSTRVDAQVNFGKFKEDVRGKDTDKRGAAAAPPFEQGYTDRFAVCWKGMIKVPKTGTYKFYLESDDGSKLWIHDVEVVDNDGKHSMDEDGGSIKLAEGYHPFRLEYFENREVEGCRLSWSADGMKKELVPASAFFHKEDMTDKLDPTKKDEPYREPRK